MSKYRSPPPLTKGGLFYCSTMDSQITLGKMFGGSGSWISSAYLDERLTWPHSVAVVSVLG
jgi:hypothetical protein